eukprot:g752.t1
MYKDYFNDIYIISPTAGNLDQTYNILGLDESSYFEPSIEILSTIMEIQQEKMDKVGESLKVVDYNVAVYVILEVVRKSVKY